jgi:hypothetical protein
MQELWGSQMQANTQIETPTAVIAGNPKSFGIFRNGAFAVPAETMNGGIILSTGNVLDALDMNMMLGTDFGPTGTDAATLTVTFRSSKSVRLEYSYVFASRELPEYGGSSYNDFFLMTAQGEFGPVKNIAFLSNNDTVSISSLVKGPLRSTGQWSPDLIANFNDGAEVPPAGGRKGTFAGRKNFGYTGFTKTLTARLTVEAGVPTVLNITIADVYDGIFDSAVFIAS